MKIYLSGAITGTNDYIQRFAKAELKLSEKGITVVNPASVNAMLPNGTSHEEYMKMSLCMLSMCDGIYMLKGWRKSTGANREYGFALGRCMAIIEE